MKKLFVLIIIVLVAYTCYNFIIDKNGITKIIKNTEKEVFYVEKYTIFGTHLNIISCSENILDGDLSFVLKNNKEEIDIDSIFTNQERTCLKLSDKNNEGIYLDGLKQGNFILLVKQKIGDKIKYYNLENKTEYNDLTYYTITKNDKNNKIEIKFDKINNKNYFGIKINRASLPENIYDVTVDPGHGGNDIGTSIKYDGKIYTESDLTLKISLQLKKELENLGLKVKLTRENDKMLENYGSNGRAVIPNKVKSKYSLSIHINSASGLMTYGGVEIYTPNDINYDLASLFANKISEIVGYSKKPSNKILDGVYFTYFTKREIQETKKEMIDKKLKPYDIIEKSPYMFMIREVGGINTHAYIDGRNSEHGLNEFYNSNQTPEPYLLELGYINYKKDLENLTNKSSLFSKAIKDSLMEYLSL